MGPRFVTFTKKRWIQENWVMYNECESKVADEFRTFVEHNQLFRSSSKEFEEFWIALLIVTCLNGHYL